MSTASPNDATSTSTSSNSEDTSYFPKQEGPEDFEKYPDMEREKSTRKIMNVETNTNQKFLDSDHPLMFKYQKDLKERLLSLLQETDEQLIELKRNITAQEDENRHFAERGYELQKELKREEEKLKSIHEKRQNQIKAKENMIRKCEQIREQFQATEEIWHRNIKRDLELQTKLEDAAFELVQLTSLQMETFTDKKTLKRAVEKTTKDRENLEVQKLRQDLLVSRLENDKFKLEDKISMYKTQWGIKKEEVMDLRKELNAANTEMETIQFEKTQIIHHWKQSIASLEKQDRVLNEIRNSAKEFEGGISTLNMDISSCKKSVRKELERNEQLILHLQFRESDIAHVQKNLKDILERETDLEENVVVMDKTVEITEQELKLLKEDNVLKEKELDAQDRDLQRVYGQQKSLEKKHMDMLHEKMTITKASKYTEKLIKDVRNAIRIAEERGSQKENEKVKLSLKLENLSTYVHSMENNLDELQKERNEKETLLNKSEANVLKTRDQIDLKRGEVREIENELREMVTQAGGQELGPFERELASLRKEITVAEQGKRHMEQEYVRVQQELFALSKQSCVKLDENDSFHKKIAVLEGKKMQLEADIGKEEKEIKDVENRIHSIESEIAQVNKILHERKEVQENLLQSSALTKNDYSKILKEAELNNLQKQNELRLLRRKKKKHLRKLFEAQRHIVYWEGKVHLVEETRKILKSQSNLIEFANLRSEIRRLQVKQEQIKKEQDSLVKDMRRAVYRHTSLYVEADKQALFGKRRKTTEYVLKRIKHAQKKIQGDKKELKSCLQQIEAMKLSESELSDACEKENSLASEMLNKIRSVEYSIDNEKQEKRRGVIKLSFKQKKARYMQKVLDGNYIRAVRDELCRLEEIGKLQSGLCAVQVITQAAMNEYPNLENVLNKIMDYIFVSKEM